MPVSEPPTLVENDIVEIVLRGELCGQTIMTVLNYRLDVASAPTLDSFYPDVADAVDQVAGIRGKYNLAACGNYSMSEISVQAIAPVRYVRYAKPVDYTGLMAEDALTADLAAVLVRQSWFAMDRTLPDMRGKFTTLHFAPVPQDKEEEGIVVESYRVGELDTLRLELEDRIITGLGNELVPIIYHRNGAAPHFTDITLSSWKPEVRVMRRRTVGRGI